MSIFSDLWIGWQSRHRGLGMGLGGVLAFRRGRSWLFSLSFWVAPLRLDLGLVFFCGSGMPQWRCDSVSAARRRASQRQSRCIWRCPLSFSPHLSPARRLAIGALSLLHSDAPQLGPCTAGCRRCRGKSSVTRDELPAASDELSLSMAVPISGYSPRGP